jgi:hypothetical protein
MQWCKHALIDSGLHQASFYFIHLLCPHMSLQVDCVAAADATNFKLHPSVEFWANYNTSFSSRSLNVQADDPNAPR